MLIRLSTSSSSSLAHPGHLAFQPCLLAAVAHFAEQKTATWQPEHSKSGIVSKASFDLCNAPQVQHLLCGNSGKRQG